MRGVFKPKIERSKNNAAGVYFTGYASRLRVKMRFSVLRIILNLGRFAPAKLLRFSYTERLSLLFCSCKLKSRSISSGCNKKPTRIDFLARGIITRYRNEAGKPGEARLFVLKLYYPCHNQELIQFFIGNVFLVGFVVNGKQINILVNDFNTGNNT